MNRISHKGKLCLVAVMAALTILFGCGTRGGVLVESGGNENAVTRNGPLAQKGPPPWAPAHGYRAKQKYLFFPDCPAYYDTDRGVYFYLEGDNWVVSVSLPDRLSLKAGTQVVLEIETDKPYLYYEDHKRKYPPGHSKKFKKKK